MNFSSLIQTIRKHWIIALLLVAAGIILVGLAFHFDVKPETLLREYGYWVILGWTFLEGETIVIVAGIMAASRPETGLNPWLIALAAFCGSFCSDQVMFSLGKYKGAAVLEHFPRLAKNVDKAAALFKKYDIALILGFRFIYGVRNVTPILLGISGVSHRKFFSLNVIGAGIWALTFSFGGYYAGKAFMRVMGQVGHGIFYILLAVAAVAGLIWFFRSRRNVSRARQVAEQGLRRPVQSGQGRKEESEKEG